MMQSCRAALTTLVAFVIVASPVDGAPPEKPNIVFILVDDLGFMDIGADNPDGFYDTPNIDRLAASGMRFTQAYAACPVCSPTRASIMTGRYPTRCNITDYINPGGGNQPHEWRRNTQLLPAPFSMQLADDEITVAEKLGAAGYATFFAGKWHLGGEGFYPEDQGFDVNRGGTEQGGPYGGRKYFSPYGNPKLSDGPDGEHLPARLARETVDFIRAHQGGPFLAFLSFYSVHTPLMGRPDLVQEYEARRALLPAVEVSWRQERGRKTRLVQDHAVYAAMVEAMDEAVGLVLDELETLGLVNDTVVIFFSDNGGLSTSEGHPTSNEPLRAGKGWLYEGGIREPCIIRAPQVTAAGSVCNTPIISIDFLPTILELAGIDPPPRLDGMSLVSLLGGAVELAGRQTIYWHYPHYGNQGGAPSGAVRAGRWKLIEWYEDGALELFDLDEDPAETVNLADTAPAMAARLRRSLALWRESVGARMPTPNPRFAPD